MESLEESLKDENLQKEKLKVKEKKELLELATLQAKQKLDQKDMQNLAIEKAKNAELMTRMAALSTSLQSEMTQEQLLKSKFSQI